MSCADTSALESDRGWGGLYLLLLFLLLSSSIPSTPTCPAAEPTLPPRSRMPAFALRLSARPSPRGQRPVPGGRCMHVPGPLGHKTAARPAGGGGGEQVRGGSLRGCGGRCRHVRSLEYSRMGRVQWIIDRPTLSAGTASIRAGGGEQTSQSLSPPSGQGGQARQIVLRAFPTSKSILTSPHFSTPCAVTDAPGSPRHPLGR